jgi:hypothetical protein
MKAILNPDIPNIQEKDLLSGSNNDAQNIKSEAPESECPS